MAREEVSAAAPGEPGPAIGIDIGGTKLVAGLVAPDGAVVARARRATPAGVEAIVALVVATVEDLQRTHGLARVPVGVGAAGVIDLDGVVAYAPNLAFRDFPLRARLAGSLGSAVTVDNDANVAAWGEYRAGAGRSATASMLMLTIGTGIGGGLVIGGRLARGAQGMGGEFGHVVLDEGGPLCNCGNRGDLEALASGTAIGRWAREAVAAGGIPPGSPLSQVAGLSGKVVTAAAQAGDPAAVAVLERAGFWLGVGIGSLVNALDPELVVVGGGAMQAGDLLLEPARTAAHDRIMGRNHRRLPPILQARLGDEAGLVGAALLALEEA